MYYYYKQFLIYLYLDLDIFLCDYLRWYNYYKYLLPVQLRVSTNNNKLQQNRIRDGACAQYHPSAP